MKDKDKQEKRLLFNIPQVYHYNTQYLGISQYADSTVVRMQNNISGGGVFSSNRYKSEEYLLNFKGNNAYLGNRMGAADFYQSGGLITLSEKALDEDLEGAIILPNPKRIKVNLSEAIINRRSVRDYEDAQMSMNDLSSILFYTQGVSQKTITKFQYLEDPLEIKLRNSPSAGGLYPIKLYFFARNISKLEDGIYVYYPENHAIKLVKTKDQTDDIGKYAEFAMINPYNVNIIMFYVYDFYINSRKYGDIGATFAMIEAGQLSQNLQLVSTSLGYGACDIGGYDKPLVEEELGIDGITKHLIHMTVIGNEEEK